MPAAAAAPAVRPEPTLAPVEVAAPHPLLRSLLWRGYAGFAEPAPCHVVLPGTASVVLIVKIRDTPHRPPAFAMGGHGAHTVLDGSCAPEYLRVVLEPLGAYRLLGLPLDELRGQTVDLTDLLGPAGAWLTERLRAEPGWRRRFTIVERLLLSRLDAGPRPAPEVRRAWQQLVATGGPVPIGRLADEVGWSHKHLIARFRSQVGLTPKMAARLVRFQRVLTTLERPDPPGWEQIAAESGYADQSHLIRDFATFAGTTPTAFLADVRGTR